MAINLSGCQALALTAIEGCLNPSMGVSETDRLIQETLDQSKKRGVKTPLSYRATVDKRGIYRFKCQ